MELARGLHMHFPGGQRNRSGSRPPGAERLVGEVGTDAARFIFLSRHYESPLDFDLELASLNS